MNFFYYNCFRSSKGSKLEATVATHSNENSENSKSPFPESNIQKQLHTIAHSIINKNPVRVEQLTSLTIAKEIDSFAYQLIETLKAELINACKGKVLDPKAHVFNPQGRHAIKDSGFDSSEVFTGDNTVSKSCIKHY